MMIEEHMINKTYFRTIVDEEHQQSPVKALGHAFYEEQMDETTDLSSVRFAQGEVYYHHRDMESAVYKWGLVKNELAPWAKKNIGDAYYELGWLNEAENTYTSIQTESTVLSIEVSLQLLALYADKNNKDKVHQYIKKALAVDPDYPNVTEIARTFYEEEQDWGKAVELAVKEAVRTESSHWFTVLTTYANKGYTKDFTPEYFTQVLLPLSRLDQNIFSNLTKSLWESYQHTSSNLAWLATINDLLRQVEVSEEEDWSDLSRLHYDSYLALMDGDYLINDLKPVVPSLLVNWMKISKAAGPLYAASAVLAWNELFPDTFNRNTLEDAERLLVSEYPSAQNVEELTALLQTVLQWTEGNDIKIGNKNKWLLSQMWNLNKKHLCITGKSQKENTAVLNKLLGEELFKGESLTVYMNHGAEQPEMMEITETGSTLVEDIAHLPPDALVELNWPSHLLNQMDSSIITAPYHKEPENGNAFDFTLTSDGVLYVVDGSRPVTDQEYKALSEFSNRQPGIPVHFIISESEGTDTDSEDIKNSLANLFPSSQVLIVKPFMNGKNVADFIRNHYLMNMTINDNRKVTRLLHVIRTLLGHLKNQRETKESVYKETVAFHKEARTKYTHYKKNVEKAETDRSEAFKKSYHDLKEKMKRKVQEDIPPLLQDTADEIEEDSDFRNIQDELNTLMNNKINDYLNHTMIPEFQSSLNTWIQKSREDISKTQAYLDEVNETFNNMYGEKRVALACDFQLLTDWKRDLNRMLNRIDVEDINIMNRMKPSQFLLKSAGKLFGNFQQNKQMLYNQYRKAIENDSFEEITDTVIEKVFFEFDLFEKSLKSDMKMCFEEPIQQLDDGISQSEEQINKAEEELQLMRDNPAAFYDPIKLFETRLLQCEMMALVPQNQ
ncbi:tetratricopeptide repeat protein [Salipaludibacillus aurantiacus]|uniref:Tetratricopeptide repeat-containing protein n=1 Tax=Salipaludibacillus aurantiacus TaxID=1601833 RepID=A0A1H9SJ71_9BACI|nr:hypothetical protein [Salipaludibacillus aurantiacus]SER85022.1 hypothetical protein SAMN05518684_104252 [Salipaludibacillus aurantiacus]